MFFKFLTYPLVLEFVALSYLEHFASLPEASRLTDLSDFCLFIAAGVIISTIKLIEHLNLLVAKWVLSQFELVIAIKEPQFLGV